MTGRELFLERRTVAALAVQGVQLIIAMVLREVVLGAAYSFSDGRVTSADQLYLLGPSAEVGLAMIGLITLLSIASTFVLATHDELRRGTWIAPVVGIVACALACVLAIVGFQPVV